MISNSTQKEADANDIRGFGDKQNANPNCVACKISTDSKIEPAQSGNRTNRNRLVDAEQSRVRPNDEDNSNGAVSWQQTTCRTQKNPHTFLHGLRLLHTASHLQCNKRALIHAWRGASAHTRPHDIHTCGPVWMGPSSRHNRFCFFRRLVVRRSLKQVENDAKRVKSVREDKKKNDRSIQSRSTKNKLSTANASRSSERPMR